MQLPSVHLIASWKKVVAVCMLYLMSLMRAHSAQNQSLNNEVEQPSQCTPGGPAGSIVTLLERLKASAASDMARKHKIATNPSKRSKGAVAAGPVKIQPKTRIREFPDQHFSVKFGKLFCDACRENLSLIFY